MARLVLFLIGLLFLASTTRADCRDEKWADDCGLVFFVTIEDSVFAPRDRVVFTIELSNRGQQPVYIPANFFKYGVLPCAVLPSGKVDFFKAIFWAPECDELPTKDDIILDVGESIEFEQSNFAHPEPGLQKWSFEGVLWGCKGIQYSLNCEIESNTVGLVVLEER